MGSQLTESTRRAAMRYRVQASRSISRSRVVSEGDCDRKDLIGWCRAHLAEFKVPRTIEFRTEIPRNPLGKILRKYLVDPEPSSPEDR